MKEELQKDIDYLIHKNLSASLDVRIKELVLKYVDSQKQEIIEMIMRRPRRDIDDSQYIDVNKLLEVLSPPTYEPPN